MSDPGERERCRAGLRFLLSVDSRFRGNDGWSGGNDGGGGWIDRRGDGNDGREGSGVSTQPERATVQIDSASYAYSELAQGVVEGGFLVGGFPALPDY